MNSDNIKVIGINAEMQLYVKPQSKTFTLIYRTATGVHWNDVENQLYSPKPREWSYFDWFKHILEVVKNEYHCDLTFSKNTVWVNIPDQLKNQIIDYMQLTSTTDK